MVSKFSNLSLATFSLLVAATLWGVFWYPLRLLESQGIPGLWVTLVAYVAAFGFSLLVWRQFRAYTISPLNLMIMALASGWCNVSFIIAVVDGVVVRVVLLFYLSPLWTVLLGRLILKERVSLGAAGVLALALIGAAIVLWDPVIGFPWPQDRADWLAVSSGMAFALANVMIRKLQQVPVTVKTQASWLGVIMVAAIWLMLVALPMPHATPLAWTGTVVMGVLVIIMTLTVQYGVTHMPVHRSAVILLFEVVAAALSAWWLANEQLTAFEWLGGLLIMAAAVWAGRVHSEPGEDLPGARSSHD